MRPIRNLCILALLAAGLTQAFACQSAPPRPDILYFYTDLDGTLLDERHEVSEENRKAIALYLSRGGHIGTATGRTPDRAASYGPAIGADLPLIFANGAIITDAQGKLLRLIAMESADDIRAMCDRVKRAGCEFFYIAHADPGSGETVVERGICRPPEDARRAVVRIRARRCRDHRKLLEELPALSSTPYSIVESGSGPWLGVSIAAPGVGKGAALGFVRERLGLGLERMAFVGDSGNDISAARYVLEHGGRCFAMKNATASLKAACPRQLSRDNEHSGVSEALRMILESEP
jgi:hydroxymethylpyrimidine pyrophosphatase-like HAD family hydrolase